MSTRFLLFLFPSTHHVLKAEKCLLAAGVAVTVIPVPKSIRSDCGIALGVAPDIGGQARQVLKDERIEPESTHLWTRRSTPRRKKR